MNGLKGDANVVKVFNTYLRKSFPRDTETLSEQSDDVVSVSETISILAVEDDSNTRISDFPQENEKDKEDSADNEDSDDSEAVPVTFNSDLENSDNNDETEHQYKSDSENNEDNEETLDEGGTKKHGGTKLVESPLVVKRRGRPSKKSARAQRQSGGEHSNENVLEVTTTKRTTRSSTKQSEVIESRTKKNTNGKKAGKRKVDEVDVESETELPARNLRLRRRR